MMYSINELILSDCCKMGEHTTHNKQSCLIDTRSEICVKRENTHPFLNSTDHQVALDLLPIVSSFQADPLSNTNRSLPEDIYEELVDPPIDQPPWVGVVKQPDKQVKKEITSKNRDDLLGQVTSLSTTPLYDWTTQMEVPTFQMKSFQDGPTPTVHQPISTYENGSSSPEYLPDWQVSKPPENNIVVTNRACPIKNCQCTCHERPHNASTRLTSFHDEEQQRPSVIMVPVNRKETASVVTHVPLRMTIPGHLSKPFQIPAQQFVQNRVIVDDSDFEKEEKYFQMATHKTKARFKLSKNDWVKIPIMRFRSGGRLLGGQWTQIFSSKVKLSNPWCSLRFKNNHVRSEDRKMHSAPFFRGAAECKRHECAVKLQFVIQEEKGKYVDVMCTGNVSHKIGY